MIHDASLGFREKLSDEIDFRIIQYQKERSFGNLRAQKEARQRAIFIELDKVPELMEQIRSENEVFDLFDKKTVTH